MANLVTSSRLLLLFLLVGLAYLDALEARIAAFILLVVIFVMDGVDGWIARRRGEESLFGAVFDIAADRIVENVLWLVLVDLGRAPVWVAVVFLARSFLVDAVRSVGASKGLAPFETTRGTIAQWIVAGRFMRAAYGAAKVLAFGWLFLLPVLAKLWPRGWESWGGQLQSAGHVLVLVAVTLCVARGLPVLVEFTLAGTPAPRLTGHRAVAALLRRAQTLRGLWSGFPAGRRLQ